jgi:hypothetical protein
MLVAIVFFNVFVAIHYNVDNVFDIANFLFPTYIILALWMGIGIFALLRTVDQRPQLRFLSLVSIIAAVLCQWLLFVQSTSFRGNTYVRDLAIERANAAEVLFQKTHRPPRLLLLNDDTLFPFWYVQKVLGYAPHAQTVWGPPLREYSRLGKLPDLVARLQKSGPVALAQWDEKIDQRFPLVLTSSTGLWRASQQRLPDAAKAVPSVQQSGFISYKVRRNEIVGFVLNFRCPRFVAHQVLTVDSLNKTKQIGFVEVLVAPRGVLAAPSPKIKARLPVYKQVRRLIVRLNAEAGQPLQAVLPLQLPLEMPPGQYDLWMRIVQSPRAESTSWSQSDGFQIVVR